LAEGDDNDDSQKTEEPTQRRLDEARKRGQVVTSREINSWAVLLAITIIATTASPYLFTEMKDILGNFLAMTPFIPTDPVALQQNVMLLVMNAGKVALFPLLVIAFTGAIAAFLQVGPLITTEPIKPDLSKLSPFKGFTRLFSMKSIVEFIKGILKIIVVGAAMYMVVKPYMYGTEHFVGQSVHYALYDMKIILGKILMTILSIMFFVAIADYLFQRFQFLKQMRMSKQEIKEEYKQTEGDPHIKGRLRQLRMRRARQRMMQNVPKADVVITNPTHYAVALKYDMVTMKAPMMVAKGVDAIALKIKELANENKVPIVENPVLARALFESMEIDQMIPEQHFQAVAEVISYVFKLKGKLKK